jgi:mitochondrial fission protein ELM1
MNAQGATTISSCWLLTDGKVGMVNQCRGLAEVIGVAPVSKVIGQRAPWRWLPPILTPASLGVASSDSDALAPPWPDLLIASGRKSVAPARAIRKASRGQTFCVQIQDPGVSPEAFDLVVAPAHDGLRGDNVISTTGSLHELTQSVLGDARARFAARVAPLPRPLLAVLLGGDNAVYRMTEAFGQKLAAQLRELVCDQGWGLAVTPSRRTPEHARRAIADALEGTGADIWDETGDNPYLGFLAHADAVLVTGDSVNMVSEATATGKPVHVAHLEGGSAKFRRFHQNMETRGITRPFTGSIETWDYEPLDDTAVVAAEIRRRIAIA